MNHIFCVLVLCAFVASCSTNNKSAFDRPLEKESLTVEKDNISGLGILKINPNFFREDADTLSILNIDSTLFGKIHNPKPDIYFPEVFLLDGEVSNARAYFPDYSILIFDAFPLENSYYRIRINDSDKIIKHSEGTTIYEDWETHISNSYLTTKSSNPLMKSNSEKSDKLELEDRDYKYLSFKVVKVDGEWAKVQCLSECEGCPEDGSTVEGWLRWKIGEKLLVRISYLC